MHMREHFNEIPGTALQSFFNQSLVRFPQILLSTDIGEAQGHRAQSPSIFCPAILFFRPAIRPAKIIGMKVLLVARDHLWFSPRD